MARKRMISPEIWESQSFGELSLLAKILFIGMISQADDDGKGILSPQLLKSKILPYDELRVADVDKALKEIGHNASADLGVETAADKAREERGHKLSVTYYVVGGKQYYIFDNWRKWQTICRPIPSKLPNPPMRGVGGEMTSHGVLNDNSMNTHGVINEHSDRKEDIEKEIEEAAKLNKNILNKKTGAGAYACEENENVQNSLENYREICRITNRDETVVDRVLEALHANGYAYDLETISQKLFGDLINRVLQTQPHDINAYVKKIVEAETGRTER